MAVSSQDKPDFTNGVPEGGQKGTKPSVHHAYAALSSLGVVADYRERAFQLGGKLDVVRSDCAAVAARVPRCHRLSVGYRSGEGDDGQRALRTVADERCVFRTTSVQPAVPSCT